MVKPDQNNPETKKKQVTNMFDGISKSYDILNRIITFGIDVFWRKRVVKIIKKHKHDNILDIATGTGDLVIELARLDTQKIIGLDISPGMLDIGKQKVAEKKLHKRIDMQLGDSEALHFDDAYFDAVRDVERATNEGFTRGIVKLEGIADFLGRNAKLDFQNEWAD